MGGINERHKEIRRRRKRRKKYDLLARRVAKAGASEKTVLVTKIRRMTIGCEQVLTNLGLNER
ncbi:MAG: DUF6800 family protein [Pirellulales bacterium]